MGKQRWAYVGKNLNEMDTKTEEGEMKARRSKIEGIYLTAHKKISSSSSFFPVS